MQKKSYYCTEGFSQKDLHFSNGQRIVALAVTTGHISEYLNPLKDAILAGQHAYNQASAITTSLERHKVLEDEVKTLRATIKAIKNKRRSLLA